MTDRQIAEMFPPGVFIEEELEARGWSKGDLAQIMGRPPQLVSNILNGSRQITLDTAQDLAAAFGTSAEYWMNLDSGYRLWKSRMDHPVDPERDKVKLRSQIFSIAPVSDLIARQWIPDHRSDVAMLEKDLLEFLEIESINEQPTYRFAARKSADLNPAHVAWFKRAKHLASAVSAGEYTPAKLEKALEQLQVLAKNAEDVRQVPEVLAAVGVRMLIVEHLPKTKIDGAAFWLSKKAPVIVLSMRYGRLDSFWFTLGHEIGHIAAGDLESLDNDLIGDSAESDEAISEQERLADEFSSRMLLSQEKLEKFIQRKGKYFSKNDIAGFAAVNGVHPAIVIGQLQHRRAINYSHSREKLVNVREWVTEAALTDGWGKVPAI